MIRMENQYGTIEISQEFFANLVGKAASECFGVAGMINSGTQSVRSAIARRELPDKGVQVRAGSSGLVIDLHIMVVYGMNIAAITKSIVNKVRYTVEQSTGFQVAKINVFVDAMKTETAI